jgi:hypothetical protein
MFHVAHRGVDRLGAQECSTWHTWDDAIDRRASPVLPRRYSRGPHPPPGARRPQLPEPSRAPTTSEHGTRTARNASPTARSDALH